MIAARNAVVRLAHTVPLPFRAASAAPLRWTRLGNTSHASSDASSAYNSTSTTTTTTTTPEPAKVPEEKMKGDVIGAMLEPSVANTSLVRSLATVSAVGLAAWATGFLPVKAVAFVHLAAFGTLLGTIVFNTFIVGLTMFRVVPRQTFGRIQSHLFPKYFALTTGAIIVLLGTLLLGAKSPALSAQAPTVLGVALAFSLVNWLGIEPITTKVMFERYDLENLPEKTEATKDQIKALYKKFGMYHGMSSVINLVVMSCAFAHAWFLGSVIPI